MNPPYLPPGWVRTSDPSSGRPYYVNNATGEKSWDPPTTTQSIPPPPAPQQHYHQYQHQQQQPPPQNNMQVPPPNMSIPPPPPPPPPQQHYVPIPPPPPPPPPTLPPPQQAPPFPPPPQPAFQSAVAPPPPPPSITIPPPPPPPPPAFLPQPSDSYTSHPPPPPPPPPPPQSILPQPPPTTTTTTSTVNFNLPVTMARLAVDNIAEQETKLTETTNNDKSLPAPELYIFPTAGQIADLYCIQQEIGKEVSDAISSSNKNDVNVDESYLQLLEPYAPIQPYTLPITSNRPVMEGGRLDIRIQSLYENLRKIKEASSATDTKQ